MDVQAYTYPPPYGDREANIAQTCALFSREKQNGRSQHEWPSHEELARQRGVNERTIRRHLARGEDVGFIYIEGREGGVWSNDGARRGQTNYYYLSLPDGMTLEDDGDGDRKDENDDDGDDDDDDGAEERNLDTDDQVCPNLGTDEQVWPDQPGQNGHQTRTKPKVSLDSCCPINPSTENPSDKSYNLPNRDPLLSYFYGFIGQNARDVESDEPFPPLPGKEEAYTFLLRLLGKGDEGRGKLIDSGTLAASRLRYPATEGKVRPSMIKKEIESYLDKMTEFDPLALRALQIALGEKGTMAEASEHIPRNAHMVPIEHWRLCFCRIDE